MSIFVCNSCKKEIDEEQFLENLNVCPNCGKHYYLDSWSRIKTLTDENSFNEIGKEINSVDFLNFTDLKSYKLRLEEARQKSKVSEAIIVGSAKISGFDVGIGVMDFSFMGGSMGSVVGERIKRLADYVISKEIPLIIVCASGGARMQEGIISLMQMVKTVSAVKRVKEKGLLYLSIITDPTTGGVSASFATVADIIISEPGALFCFAGPRVVEQTIKKKLPEDFGLAERNLRNGQVDMILNRKDLKPTLAKLLGIFTKEDKSLIDK
jgi:acetyl-CoA carboxylase carboxyl transferase subunit beta